MGVDDPRPLLHTERDALRTLLRISIPVDSGNAAIEDGSLPKIIGGLMEKLKPEAAYFLPEGERTALLIFDMKDASECASIAETLYSTLDAEVDFSPIMNIDDLKKGLGVA